VDAERALVRSGFVLRLGVSADDCRRKYESENWLGIHVQIRRAVAVIGAQKGTSKKGSGRGPIPFLNDDGLDCFASGETELGNDVSLIATAARACTAALTCLVAVPAKYRTITAWFKWNSRWLAAAGADHWSAMGRSLPITGASPTLIALLCHTARLAALGGRITAFLEERLIRSGERKFLSTIAARKLHISGHGCPRGDCT